MFLGAFRRRMYRGCPLFACRLAAELRINPLLLIRIQENLAADLLSILQVRSYCYGSADCTTSFTNNNTTTKETRGKAIGSCSNHLSLLSHAPGKHEGRFKAEDVEAPQDSWWAHSARACVSYASILARVCTTVLASLSAFGAFWLASNAQKLHSYSAKACFLYPPFFSS